MIVRVAAAAAAAYIYIGIHARGALFIIAAELPRDNAIHQRFQLGSRMTILARAIFTRNKLAMSNYFSTPAQNVFRSECEMYVDEKLISLMRS